MKHKVSYELLEEYARLLRRAWLNPSYKPWQDAVYAFEGEHDMEFSPLFREWRDKD